MKIFQYLGSALVLTFSMTSVVLGGGIAGGGGPPSKDILGQLLWNQQLKAFLTLTLPQETYGPLGTATTLDAVNSEGQKRSYRVMDGDEPGTLILIDRRLLLREAGKAL